MGHERFLGLLSTHVPEVPRDSEAPSRLLAALGAGRSYLTLDWVAPAAGFELWAESDEARLEMGEEALAGDWTINARSPGEASIRLVRDGRRIAQRQGTMLSHRADGPGVWRVEAWLEHDGVPRRWIVSNPIYLRPSDQ